MSSIPSSKMKHAHAHEGDHPEQAKTPTHQAEPQGGDQAQPTTQDAGVSAAPEPTAKATPVKDAGPKLSGRAQRLVGRAEDLAEDAVDAVTARPRTAAVIGAAILAGAAALVGGPAAARRLRGEEPEKTAAKRKPAAKKPVAKRAKARD